MAKTKSTDVATKEEPKLPAVPDYGEDAGAGFEGTKGSDLSIPFINLMQSNSPQVQKNRDGTIRVGTMVNSVTGDVIDGEKGVVFLPVYKEEAWVEWIPRSRGGGFVQLHDPQGETVVKTIEKYGSRIPKKGSDGKKIPIMLGDNELVETFYLYGLILDEQGQESNGFAVIPFTSTKIKVFRDFQTSMYLIKGRPPIYAFRAKVLSEIQTNEFGTFANYQIRPFGKNWVESLIPPDHPLYEEAKGFRKMVVQGLARADFTQQQGPDDSDVHAGGGGGKGGKDQEDPPF